MERLNVANNKIWENEIKNLDFEINAWNIRMGLKVE